MITILTYIVSTLIVSYLFSIIYVQVIPVIKDVIKAFKNSEITKLF